MLKRDLSYNLFSRKLQALEELFPREPEDWAERAGFAKREPSSGGGPQPLKPAPQPISPGPAPRPNSNSGSGASSLISSINS